jgi:hypothetical protein
MSDPNVKKTIQITPELFKVGSGGGGEKQRRKERRGRPTQKANPLKKELMNKIKQHASKNNRSLKGGKDFTSSFEEHMDYLNTLAQKRKLKIHSELPKELMKSSVSGTPPMVSAATPVSVATPVSAATPVSGTPPMVSVATPVSGTPPMVSVATPVSGTQPMVSAATPVSGTPPMVSVATPVSAATPVSGTSPMVSVATPVSGTSHHL